MYNVVLIYKKILFHFLISFQMHIFMKKNLSSRA